MKNKIEEILNNVIDDFNTKWKSHEEKTEGISQYASEILALQQPPVINCATCKHQEVSKHVEPCYGCNDYSNHQIKGGIVL